VPVSDVLLIVKVLTPLNQIVHLALELHVVQSHEPLIVKGISIHLLDLLLVNVLDHWLVSKDLGVLGVLVELPKPLELLDSLLFGRQLLALCLVEVELGRLIGGPQLNSVVRREYLVRDGPPAIVFKALVPTIVFVIRVLVETNIDCRLLLIFLDLDIVPWRECVDVHD